MQVLQFDPTLREEIEYDLRHFEKNKANAAAAAAAEQEAAAAIIRGIDPLVLLLNIFQFVLDITSAILWWPHEHWLRIRSCRPNGLVVVRGEDVAAQVD